MAGLFGVLDVASRGLLVTQQGIHTTAHNIANVNSPNYARQRQIVSPAPPLVRPNGALGTGAEQTSVERISDVFTQAQIVKQNAYTGSTDVQANALGQIEEVVNEQQGEGITSALSAVYRAFSDLATAQAPGAPVERESLRGAAQSLVDTLHGADAQLRDLQGATQVSISGVVNEINELSARIADLNVEIVNQETMTSANDLRDERDALVRELSTKIEVNAYEERNGAQIVFLSSGMPLVESTTSHQLVEIADPTNPFDPTFSRIGFDAGGTPVDITADISGGELGGLLRVRDTIVPAAIRSLDTIAYNLAETVNVVHQGGVGLDGTVGDFFAPLAAVEDAARNIALDANIVARTDAIAAGLTTAPGDNTNALALAALRDQEAPLFLPGDPPGPATGPTRTVLGHTASVVADIGQQARSLSQSHDQQLRVTEVLMNRRDELSGVSLDEEVTKLIELQASFQANARIVSTVDRLLQDVLALL